MPFAKLVTVMAVALGAGFPLQALATVIFDISVTANELEPGFDTASVNARAGESINFVLGKDVTVMRSTFNAPCTPYHNVHEVQLDPPVALNGVRSQQVHLSETYDGSPLWFASTAGCRKGVVFAINPSQTQTWEAFRARAIQLAATETFTHPPPLVQTTPPIHLPPGLPHTVTEAPGHEPVMGGGESNQSTGRSTSDPRTNPIPTTPVSEQPSPTNPPPEQEPSQPEASHPAPTDPPAIPTPTHPAPTNPPPTIPIFTHPVTPIHLPPGIGEQIQDGSTPGTLDPSKDAEDVGTSTGHRGDGPDHVGQVGQEGSVGPPGASDLTSHPGITSNRQPTATRTITVLPGTTIVEVQYEDSTQSHSQLSKGSASAIHRSSAILALLLAVLPQCVS